MKLELTPEETKALRAAFQMYQVAKRREAAHNKDQNKVKGYATLLGIIETLQEKIGYGSDKDEK